MERQGSSSVSFVGKGGRLINELPFPNKPKVMTKWRNDRTREDRAATQEGIAFPPRQKMEWMI
jgi:hypothetical protein